MKIISVPCSFDNYSYLLICEKSGKAAAVDPTEAYPLLVELEKNQAQLTSVFCTHHHHDHIGGIEDLLNTFAGVGVVCHTNDKTRIPSANIFVHDGDTVKVGQHQGCVLYTPGHTNGSICYHFENHLLTGDTLFGAGCGRLFEGTPAQMYNSLVQKIAILPGQTKIYFGHEYTRKNLEFALMIDPENNNVRSRLKDFQNNGEISTPSSLELEKKTNPFLQSDSVEMRRALERTEGRELSDPLQVFTLLRQLRNSY